MLIETFSLKRENVKEIKCQREIFVEKRFLVIAENVNREKNEKRTFSCDRWSSAKPHILIIEENLYFATDGTS